MPIKFKASKLAQKAMSLTEVLVAMGASGVLILVTTVFLSNQQENAKELEQMMSMKALAMDIEEALSNPKNIFSSATLSTDDGNKALKECILSSPLCQRHATDLRRQLPFELITSLGREAVTIPNIQKHRVAGTKTKPAIYRIKNRTLCPIDSTAGDCNLEVRTYFWANCPTDDASLGTAQSGEDDSVSAASAGNLNSSPSECSRAQTINLRYQVVMNNRAVGGGAVTKVRRTLPSIPTDEAFWDDKPTLLSSSFGATSLPVALIVQDSDLRLQCGPNYTITGIKDRKAICECIYPFKEETAADGSKSCTGVTRQCRANERYRGVNLDGTIICQPIYCESTLVESLNSDSSPSPVAAGTARSEGCNKGGWIESIRPAPQRPPAAGTGAAAHPIPETSCYSQSPCAVDKWGGSCTSVVKCFIELSCCYELNPRTVPPPAPPPVDPECLNVPGRTPGSPGAHSRTPEGEHIYWENGCWKYW
ncbi:MAG: hypothetical protein KA436_04380 [Oligoflexales bacterium]|nr:hypothetical protein [Oligoflexales bacterium]